MKFFNFHAKEFELYSVGYIALGVVFMEISAIFERHNWQKVRNTREGDRCNYLGNRMETDPGEGQ